MVGRTHRAGLATAVLACLAGPPLEAEEIRVPVPRPIEETRAIPDHPYVQQHFRLTVWVYAHPELRDARLEVPFPPGVTANRLGKDRESVVRMDGRAFRVLERRWSVFAHASGAIRFPPPEYTARYQPRAEGPGLNLYGRSFAPQTEALGLQARSAPLVVEVRPRPQSVASGALSDTEWLPAVSVELSERWAPSPPRFRVGEPDTRLLTIFARGLTGAQLPELATPSIPGLVAYPIGSTTVTRIDGGSVVATRVQRIAYIRREAGPVKLPDLRLPWWDVRADRLRVATLPGFSASSELDESGEPGSGVALDRRDHPRSIPAIPRWLPVSLALLSGLLGLWFWLGRRRGSRDLPDPSPPLAGQVRAWCALRRALACERPEIIRDALLQAARTLLAPVAAPHPRRARRSSGLERDRGRALELGGGALRRGAGTLRPPRPGGSLDDAPASHGLTLPAASFEPDSSRALSQRSTVAGEVSGRGFRPDAVDRPAAPNRAADRSPRPRRRRTPRCTPPPRATIRYWPARTGRTA